MDVVYSLAPSYRAGAVWVINSNTAKTLRKLKNTVTTSGSLGYLWTESTAQGQPDRLLGYPVVTAEDMPDIGANTFPIAFGNFERGYVIVDKTGSRALRDPYTKPGWVRMYHYRRVHGSLADSNAIKLLKIATS